MLKRKMYDTLLAWKNEDKKESSGCGSSTVAFAALSACAVVAVFGLKKKEDK